MDVVGSEIYVSTPAIVSVRPIGVPVWGTVLKHSSQDMTLIIVAVSRQGLSFCFTMSDNEIHINIKGVSLAHTFPSYLPNHSLSGPSELKIQISISLDKTVLDLKRAIAEKSDVEADRQRLIYSGSCTIAHYNHVSHLSHR